MNYKDNPPTQNELEVWNQNKNINPRTSRKILKNGPTYKILENKYNNVSNESINGIHLDIKNYKCLQKLDKSILDEILNVIDEIYINLPNTFDIKKKIIDKNLLEKLILDKSEIDEIDYDTTDNYKNLRINKIDPITFEKVDTNTAFVFPWKWNPYSGERLNELDENGPLYFDPDNLIHFYYKNRLNNLWISESDENSGVYHGYYGDAVGLSPDFEVKGRGKYYEWYLFRLPIIDCYLEKDHNNQYVTMGPKLTNNEIKNIFNLANKNKNNYKNNFHKKRPNIVNMKYIYDEAVNKEPYLGFDKELEQHLFEDDLINRRCKINRDNVDILVNFN